jgi:Ca-activated chloride channel family protein
MKRAINRNTGATAGLVAAMAGVTGAASVASVALAMQPFAPGSAVSPPATTITFVADGPFILTPQIVSRRHPSMPERPVRVSNVDASVSIVEQLATTNLEITLTNSSGRAQEAQIVLPVPEGASVRSFQYDGTGPEPTATLIARDDARRYYESIVNASRDPGLLEFVGLSAIRSSVFPVPAGASQKVRIVYEQVLKANDGRVDYVLPRSDGLAATQTPWSVKVEVRAGKEISSVFSPTHAMVTQRLDDGKRWTSVIDSGSLSQPGAVTMSFITPRKPGEAVSSIVAYPDAGVNGGKGGYFMMVIGLPRADVAVEAMKREVTLVIDRSGSMRGEKIEQARKSALQIIDGLNPGEMFNIIDYSDSIASFEPAPVVKDKGSAERARQYIMAIASNGGTNLNDALMEALRAKPAPGTLPLVLFMTDGLATVGEKSEVKIRENAKAANSHGRRVFTFGVGYDVNSPLLSGLATTTRGSPTFVLPGEDVESKVSQTFARLNGPTLASPVITGPFREMVPSTLNDVFEGEQVIIVGQYHEAGPMNVTLAGRGAGGDRSFAFNLSTADTSARNGYVGRLWAQRKIATLIDSIRQATAEKPTIDPKSDPATKELVDEIVRLSTKFGILTEYTAFLATEPGAKFAGNVADSAGRDLVDQFNARNSARAGAAGVSQEFTNLRSMTTEREAKMQYYYDASMSRREIGNVQSVNDRAFVQRHNRWIDMRMLDAEALEPQVTVVVGTPEYLKVVEQLRANNLAGALSLQGDIYVTLDNQRVLIKQE